LTISIFRSGGSIIVCGRPSKSRLPLDLDASSEARISLALNPGYGCAGQGNLYE
jgi:hypothetical protein